ncbi:unnamed protein product [Euphydryas editha]|uniref:Uncharacterized protein n=1 Tax=Euphydryas editha TaxID=104508 RepID=A0AAU9TMN8_EUPED|nr:unnamed protein product [Euphydryas editha]
MSHLRNPRLSRNLDAMESTEDLVGTENSKQISMDDLNYNFSRDANPITVDTRRSSLLQERTLRQSVSQTKETECHVHPTDDGMPNPYLSGTGFPKLTPEDPIIQGPSIRARSHSTSSELYLSPSSTTSSSSSSSSASESGKDFSPDEADCDPDYVPATPPRRISFSPTPQSSISVQLVKENNLGPPEDNKTPNKRRRKGFKNVSMRQDAKRLRNSGLQYISVSKFKKVMPKKQIGPPCGEKCRLKCSKIIKQEDRENIFDNYWKMGDLTRQRDYIAKCIDVIKPKYQYKVHNSNRGPKNSFSFEINNFKHRVCKIFFKNTLAINNRPIATVIAKKNQAGTVEEEKRGKHGKQNKVSSDIIKGIKNHIDSIPRIESHYLRQQTTREYIDGGKNLTDLYTDYQKECLNNGVEAAKIHTYRKVFNEDYNIGFHTPKKDQCELCISFQNAVDKTI